MKVLKRRSIESRSKFRFILLILFWRILTYIVRGGSAFYHLGNHYYAYGDTSYATKMWQSAVTKDNNHYKAWHNIVQCAIVNEDWERAKVGLQVLCHNSIRNFEYTNLYAYVLRKQERYEELENWYQSQLYGPHQLWAIQELGKHYIKLNKLDKGYIFLKTSVEDYPTNATIWKLLGICCMKSKNYSKALTALKRSNVINENPEINILIEKISFRLMKEGGSYNG